MNNQSCSTHPLIKSLYTTSKLEGKYLRAWGPSYIPSRQFALALLHVVARPPAGGPGAAAPAPASTLGGLLAAINQNTTLQPEVAGALEALISDAGDDMERVKTNIERWFDGSMDRVAGWYKRRAQFILLIIGAIVAVVINVDSLAIVNTLSNDSAVRSALVTAAETYIREHPEGPSDAKPAAGRTDSAEPLSDRKDPATAPTGSAPTNTGQAKEPTNPPVSLERLTSDIRSSVRTVSQQLGSLGLPVGWRRHDSTSLDRPAPDNSADDPTSRRYLIENRIWPGWSLDWWWYQVTSHLLGWLLTAIAVSFGAPFWFDTLNKIMVVRSTVKPREKSGEEASEDRQASGRS